MNEKRLKTILEGVSDGNLSVKDAFDYIKHLPYRDLGYAMVDHHRSLRTEYPETIFAQGKTIDQIVGIAGELIKKNTNVMVTRASLEVYKALKTIDTDVVYHEKADIVVLNPEDLLRTQTNILVISAGTSDIKVCEEVVVTAEIMGSRVERLYDVGVSGVHRLFSSFDKIESSGVIVVVAGMDGVLPSVVAGLTNKLVIAVPTSVGYGASFNGLAALLTMLNSCSNSVTVVNIDNGYGAGYSAAVINRIANRAAIKSV